ncbi:MAG: hypothetical protein LQ337_006953 [Flavoplaca oasis]|nr:MAG: hypothetical protein LQ337_006953 [Flavoplaca oasis]
MVAEDGATSPTWKFTQCFGDKGDVEDITEADIISTVEFDHTGNYLATGDKGGRVVLFERNETKKTCEYKFHTEFQSHEPEFDYLKSLEIEEKINKIKWCRRQNASHYLLSTNDKTIKLWKVFEKSLKVVAENNLSHDLTPGGALGGGGGAPRPNPNVSFRDASSLKLPRLTHHDTVVAAVPRRTYANAHAYHINSISVNSDGETFISSDDLRINLWNLNIQDQSFNIVDIKPANMEELTEVITAAEFHPQSCNWFMYASSKGTIKLADMRESALCDQHAKQFEQEEDPSSRSFFSEIISSISDVRFSNDGRYILSRDYLTVKIWDVNMERTPVKTIPIHEHLRPRLCDTYENDSIFDKFEVVFSGDAKNVMTGSYNNNFMIYPSDPEKEMEVVLQADKSAFKAKKVGIPTPINPSGPANGPGNKKGNSRAGSPAAGIGGQGGRMRKETDADQIDFNKKILHMSWHPFEDSIAIAATNNLFVFSALHILAVKYVLLLETSPVQHNQHRVVLSKVNMARNRKGPKMTPPTTPPVQPNGLRHRDFPVPPGTKTIYVGPLLKAPVPPDPDSPFTLAKAIGVTLATLQATLPALISWGVTVALIFGGCCSNVFALETIVKEQPHAGNLITFVQFLVTACLTWPTHFSTARPPFFLKPRAIPIIRWLPYIALFFTVNFLNNYAFGYNISVPVHIILRSGGSVTTMLVGFIWGKRYTPVQIMSVAMLTIGIIVAAMADARSKGKSTSGPSKIDPSFLTGFGILFFAQVLSAIMGVYTQVTYATYGSHWHENLFYSHALSLPLFIPFIPSLRSQFQDFLSSPPIHLSPAYIQPFLASSKGNSSEPAPNIPSVFFSSLPALVVPKDILYLALNALTQYLCIRGVNLLGARTSALGVTIVLNMRKLASLLLSIWLFGNQLPPGVLLGAMIVFGSAGIWAWEGQRIGKRAKSRID